MTDVDIHFDDTALEHLLNDPEGPVARDLERRALQVEAAQIRLLSHHGTGRIYKRRGRTHQASAPGRPPAVDTGHLRATVGHHVHQEPGVGLVADIGSGANPAVPGTKVAEWTEYGTRNMEPRPWLRPSLDSAKD